MFSAKTSKLNGGEIRGGTVFLSKLVTSDWLSLLTQKTLEL